MGSLQTLKTGSHSGLLNSAPNPSAQTIGESTHFAAMIYYIKNLFSRGPKLTAVQDTELISPNNMQTFFEIA